MKTVHKSVLIWFSAEEMFALVTDVARYPEFLPWCDRAGVVDTHVVFGALAGAITDKPLPHGTVAFGEVEGGAQIHAEKLAVLGERHLRDRNIVAALRVAHKMVRAIGGPLDGFLQLLCRHRDQRIFAVRKQFCAETAADVALQMQQEILRGQHERLGATDHQEHERRGAVHDADLLVVDRGQPVGPAGRAVGTDQAEVAALGRQLGLAGDRSVMGIVGHGCERAGRFTSG